MTYEALIYIDEFVKTNTEGNPVNISSVMGVEQYLLLRIGDTNFEREQLQFDGSGSGSGFGKIPGRDAMKHLETGRWYHVACTYDQNTRTARIYVDGQIQSEVTGVGITTPERSRTASTWPCGRSTTCGTPLPRATRPSTKNWGTMA